MAGLITLHLPGETRQFENTNEALIELVEEVNTYVKETDLIFSHLMINGTEVYEAHYQYLLDQLLTLEEVIVVLKQATEVVTELQQSLNDYLDRALPIINQLSDQFYQGESEEGWSDIADLAEGLEWILSAVQTLENYTENETKLYYNGIAGKLQLNLQELLEAIEARDTVTIADIIQYELVEALTELKQSIHH